MKSLSPLIEKEVTRTKVEWIPTQTDHHRGQSNEKRVTNKEGGKVWKRSLGTSVAESDVGIRRVWKKKGLMRCNRSEKSSRE